MRIVCVSKVHRIGSSSSWSLVLLVCKSMMICVRFIGAKICCAAAAAVVVGRWQNSTIVGLVGWGGDLRRSGRPVVVIILNQKAEFININFCSVGLAVAGCVDFRCVVAAWYWSINVQLSGFVSSVQRYGVK